MDDEHDAPRQKKKPKVKESIIDHTYRDYSQVEVSSDEETTTHGGDEKKQTRLQPNFPAKLHAIVSNPNYQHIICWQPHGRSWKIVDKHLLSTVICPKHFAHAKFESFNRSVNGWGFKRLLNPGPDCKSYYHECFLRGRPELTKLMQRLVNPGKRLPDKAGEPDFYEISRKYPLPAAPASTSQEDAAAAAMSPHHPRPGQPNRFGFQGAQAAAGYPYAAYYQAGPYPQMPSPAAYGQPFPPQPPQQAFWPNQMPMYPPNPSAYGYYPYPQMMAAPQGFDPQSFQHPSMYGQYYPATPTSAYGANPASPERLPPPAAAAAAQGQPPPQIKAEHGQYYQSPGPRPGALPGTEGEATDERKPPAQAGVKRSLEDGPADIVYAPRTAVQAHPTHQLEGSEPPPHAASAHASAARSAQGAAYGHPEQPGVGNVPGATANAPSEGANAGIPPGPPGPTGQAPGGAPNQGQGGEGGPNEQQLLQDFFQQY